MRDLIGKAGGQPPRVRIRLDVRQLPNLKSALVWGTLPASDVATGETIYIMAHRDGWFDSATDNASGVATMLGLAEPFAKIPQSRRRRTIDGERIRRTNTYTAQLWYAGGPTRPKLQELAIHAFREFGVSTYAEPEQAPPPGDLGRFFRFVPASTPGDFNMYFHTETPEMVPWTGLEASTRAYARIIDGVNGLALKDL